MQQNKQQKVRLGANVDLNQDISQFFLQERLRRDWSQKEMALALGVSQPTVSRLESGTYKDFNVGFIAEMVAKLSVTPRMVFEQREE